MNPVILSPSMMCVNQWSGAEQALEALRQSGV